MMHDHSFYEMQSALAAMGELTAAELADLEQHLISCASCRECTAEMAQMSRHLFLLQAKKRKGRGTPRGMQARFTERAAKTGIPLVRSSPTVFESRFVHVTMIVLLLTFAGSLGWEKFSSSDARTNAYSIPLGSVYQTSDPELAFQVSGGGTASPKPLMIKARSRRRSAPWTRKYVMVPYQGVSDRLEPLRDFKWDRSAVIQPGEGLQAQVEIPLPVSLNGSCFNPGGNCKPQQRIFKLNHDMASLSSTDFLQAVSAGPRMPGLKFDSPVFHLNSTRAW